jgi:hypothetical protein
LQLGAARRFALKRSGCGCLVRASLLKLLFGCGGCRFSGAVCGLGCHQLLS